MWFLAGFVLGAVAMLAVAAAALVHYLAGEGDDDAEGEGGFGNDAGERPEGPPRGTDGLPPGGPVA